jgi:hypothetical protein
MKDELPPGFPDGLSLSLGLQAAWGCTAASRPASSPAPAAADPAAAIAAAVIVRDGRVLLVRRRVAEGSLSWQFPAGKIEPGETAQEAAVREAREEAAVVSVAS